VLEVLRRLQETKAAMNGDHVDDLEAENRLLRCRIAELETDQDKRLKRQVQYQNVIGELRHGTVELGGCLMEVLDFLKLQCKCETSSGCELAILRDKIRRAIQTGIHK
jgi:hypothetical protein